MAAENHRKRVARRSGRLEPTHYDQARRILEQRGDRGVLAGNLVDHQVIGEERVRAGCDLGLTSETLRVGAANPAPRVTITVKRKDDGSCAVTRG